MSTEITTEAKVENKKGPKKWYKSKTMVFNAVMAGLGALEASNPGAIPGLGQTLVVLLPVVNAVLRTVTHQPVGK